MNPNLSFEGHVQRQIKPVYQVINMCMKGHLRSYPVQIWRTLLMLLFPLIY